MYFTSQTVLAARLAALDQYRTASTILLDSTTHLIELYNDAKDQTLNLARDNEFHPAPALFKELVQQHLHRPHIASFNPRPSSLRGATSMAETKAMLAKVSILAPHR